MQYRTFPGTDVAVSEIGFGTWTLATAFAGRRQDVVYATRIGYDIYDESAAS